jgi:cob(I)alamin adenosyltransferase
MAKLYTRKGDKGDTSLFDGTTVRKNDLRVEAYGQVDELNAHIGMAACMAGEDAADDETRLLQDRLVEIQHRLLVIGSVLATPPGLAQKSNAPMLATQEASLLETWIDEACASPPPLREFILPGGCRLACQLHVCRTVCRRAERKVVALAGQSPIPEQVVIYLNRLGDLLFAWARWISHHRGQPEERWDRHKGVKKD